MSTVNERATRRIGRQRDRREGERAIRDLLETLRNRFDEFEAASRANREFVDVMREVQGLEPIRWLS